MAYWPTEIAALREDLVWFSASITPLQEHPSSGLYSYSYHCIYNPSYGVIWEESISEELSGLNWPMGTPMRVCCEKPTLCVVGNGVLKYARVEGAS